MFTARILFSPFFCLLLFSTLAFAQQRKYTVLFSEMIFFETARYEISSEQWKKLDKAILSLEENRDAEIMVLAHTDSIGSYARNKELAEARAASVRNYLLKKGVDSSRIDMRAFGSLSPLRENSTAEGRAINRRVSFYVQVPYDESRYEAWSVLYGQLSNKEGKPLAGQIHFYYLNGHDSLDVDSTGRYSIRFEGEIRQIEVRAYAKGYFFVSRLVKAQNQNEQELSFRLEPALLGQKMLLNDLYFRAGTPMLLPSSEAAIEGLANFLLYNDNIHIEIGGHINKPNMEPVPKESPSFRLSEQRAQAVYEQLLYLGLPKNRLSYKGYGNSEMMYPEASTEIEQQLNRRVEIKILRID